MRILILNPRILMSPKVKTILIATTIKELNTTLIDLKNRYSIMAAMIIDRNMNKKSSDFGFFGSLLT